jgi:hypothetical protein
MDRNLPAAAGAMANDCEATKSWVVGKLLSASFGEDDPSTGAYNTEELRKS